MKNLKLLLIVSFLVVANLYILINISFEIKYRELIHNYNQLQTKYEELEDQYLTQSEQLEEVMAKLSDEEDPSTNKFYEKIGLDVKSIKGILNKLDFGINGVMKIMDTYIFK